MALFQELDLAQHTGGSIVAVEADSVGDVVGIRPGDELLAINDNPVQDIIDVQFYSAEEELELLVRRGDDYFIFEAEREYDQSLGLDFAHPTFDTDIRRCNNLCEFCFVLQMAPKFRRTLYIKDDDYRYSFLFGHFVTLTNLSEHDWWRIETMGLSPLYVSVHVTDLELRRRFLRNKTAPDIMTQLRWLAERDIEVHTQLVVVPEFNDGVWLERSVEELASLWPTVQSISVVPVGLTKQHKYKMRTHTSDEAEAVLDYVLDLQARFQTQVGNRFVYPTDEWYLVSGREVPPLDFYDGQQLHENGLGMVRRFLDMWEAEKEEIANCQLLIANGEMTLANCERVTLVTGTLFGATLRRVADEFARLVNVDVQVVVANNERFGHSITAAGLLMGTDVVAQLQAGEVGDLVVLPRVMFDHPDTITLDDMTPEAVAKALNKPVVLADTMGDVWDALTGQANVRLPQTLITLDG